MENDRNLRYAYVPYSEIARNVLETNFHKISFACRLNILTMIKFAGSGHIGSSMSAVDLVLASRLFLKEVTDEGYFFSSKGHDAPAIYAVSHALGELSDDDLFRLRRLNGLPGHPEIQIPGVPTNTGSLGMGISKGKGFIYAARNQGKQDPTVIVLLGDGELQEGQIWESLSGASRDSMNSLTVIVDGNKIQSDTWVESVLPLGNLRKRVEGFGWNFLECDGHSYEAIKEALEHSKSTQGPTFVYAHTVKSSGVPFMTNFGLNARFYRFHSGAPSDNDYELAISSLSPYLNDDFTEAEIAQRARSFTQHDVPEDFKPKDRADSLVQEWNFLLHQACENDARIVAIDADLSYDTGTYGLSEKFPNQYIQAGIAEQDMVSTAGTIALSGCIPIVHSFASFLTTRSIEQIFNNTTEETRIIYVGFLAGIVPTAPGHSHQAVIDVGIMSSIPGISIYEPSSDLELQIVFDLARRNSGPSYIRINSIGMLRNPHVPNSDSTLFAWQRGQDFALITSGITMTDLAIRAFSSSNVAIFSRPYLNQPITDQDREILSAFKKVLILENYTDCNANFFHISNGLLEIGVQCYRYGIKTIPKNGEMEEVLRFHKLDPESIKSHALTVFS